VGVVGKYRRLKERMLNRWKYWRLLTEIEKAGFSVNRSGTVTCTKCEPEEACCPGHHCVHSTAMQQYMWRLRQLQNEYRRI
jgi:3-deoxy-D-manno-octulosonic acid (KDO) 8-phosphate synthase